MTIPINPTNVHQLVPKVLRWQEALRSWTQYPSSLSGLQIWPLRTCLHQPLALPRSWAQTFTQYIYTYIHQKCVHYRDRAWIADKLHLLLCPISLYLLMWLVTCECTHPVLLYKYSGNLGLYRYSTKFVWKVFATFRKPKTNVPTIWEPSISSWLHRPRLCQKHCLD